jgi:hypothetical protein
MFYQPLNKRRASMKEENEINELNRKQEFLLKEEEKCCESQFSSNGVKEEAAEAVKVVKPESSCIKSMLAAVAIYITSEQKHTVAIHRKAIYEYKKMSAEERESYRKILLLNINGDEK